MERTSTEAVGRGAVVQSNISMSASPQGIAEKEDKTTSVECVEPGSLFNKRDAPKRTKSDM